MPDSRIRPSNSAPPSTPAEEDDCYAPATGTYAPHIKWTPEMLKAAGDYQLLVRQQIFSYFSRHMLRAASDPWVKAKKVAVRFAILPDGSYLTPIVTMSSGRSDFDNNALNSIGAFSAFPPLPASITQPMPFCIHFEYNVDRTGPKPPDLWPPKPKQ